jgi:hypothetical protein
MAKLLRILAGALIVVAVAWFGVTWLLYPTVTKRFRYDVTLEVDGREVSGSTVWQMTSQKLFNPLGSSLPFKHNVRGEAIAFPLSDDEVLFVLRRGLGSISTREHGALLLTNCGFADLHSLSAFEGSCEAEHNPPEIVIARGDLASSALPQIDFQETGPIQTERAKFVRRAITTTTEPITTGIADRYPWIANLALPSNPGPNPGEGTVWMNKLYVQDFTTEIDIAQ